MGCCNGDSNDKVRTFDTNEFQSIPDSDPRYGEPLKYDITFKGPLNNRSCTDVLCLLIFIIFIGAWIAIAVYAATTGDLNKLLVPTDTQNRKCGIDSNVLNKPYLFFFNLEKCISPLTPITGCPTPQVCVEKCPEERFIYTQNTKNEMTFEQLKQKLICQTNEDKDRLQSFADVDLAMKNERCATWYVSSKNFLNRCIWDFTSSICPYIPTFLLNNRYKRSTTSIDEKLLFNSTISDISNNDFNFAQNFDEHLIFNNKFNEFPNTLEILDQRVQVQEGRIEKCVVREKLGEEIIIRKMKQTDTYLSRFVGNLVAHFYPGENPQEVIASRCVPNDNSELEYLIDNYNLPSEIKWVVERLRIGDDVNLFGQKVVEDIVNSWITILIALIIVMVVALIYIALMRWVAGPVIWFSILGVLVGLAVGCYVCVKQFIYYRDHSGVAYHDNNIKAQLKTWFEDKTAWMVLAIICAVLFLIILLLVIFLRKRIIIAIALVKEGSKAVATIISSVFFPIFPWVLQVLAIGFAIAIGLYLASIGEPAFKVVGPLSSDAKCVCEGDAQSYTEGSICKPETFNTNCYSTESSPSFSIKYKSNRIPCVGTGCYFEKITNPSHISYLHAYNVIGFLWVAFFISAFGEMVLAATFATWYWTFHKSDVPYFTLTKAFLRTSRYHIGTLAFGALILTICRIIRLILEYIDAKLKKFDNSFTRAILCCMKCFFWCLESFLRFMNRNAYIMCAIHGKNFCSSAKDAFNLLMRNFLRVVALDKVTDFLFFLSKILLTIAAGFATYYYVEFAFVDKNKLHYIGVPTTIVVLGTYLIATVFFGVYSMAVDTLFLCFLEDCERNDGSEEKPYYMSKQLMKILRKHNKLPRHQYN